MISVVLLSLLVGNAMAAPLNPVPFSIAGPSPSVQEIAAYQLENRQNLQPIAEAASYVFGVSVIYTGLVAIATVIKKLRMACVLVLPISSCDGINLLSNNLKAIVDLPIMSNLDLAASYPNSSIPSVLDPEQLLNYLKFSDLAIPPFAKSNDDYPEYLARLFAIVASDLERAIFPFVMHRNWMANVVQQPVANPFHFVNGIIDGLDDGSLMIT